MGKLTFSGVRARVLLLVALSVAPWLALTIYHAVEDRGFAVDVAQESALQLARLISFDQRETISRSRHLLQTLSSLPEIKNGAPADCRLRLHSLLDSTESYANIGVMDVHGNLLCDAVATKKSINVSDRRWFRDALNTRHFVIGSFIISRTTGKPVIVTAQPLLDAQGRVHRVVFASIDISWLEHLLQQVKLPAGMAVSVLDANGVFL
ncbi:MAG: cache domain-containing protein, partial [Sulfuriferula sp.]